MSEAAAALAILNLLKRIPLYRLPDEDASGSAPGAKTQAELHETYRHLDMGLSILAMILIVPLGFAWLQPFQLIAGQAHPDPGVSG